MEELSKALENKALIVIITRSGDDPGIRVIARDTININSGKLITDHHDGDVEMTINRGLIQQLALEGKISQAMSVNLIATIEDSKYLNKNEPALNGDASHLLDTMNEIRHLLALENPFDHDFSLSKIPADFSNRIDTAKCFGIVKILTDRFRYIPELLQSSELVPLPREGPQRYLIRSSMALKDMGEMGLSYAFTLASGLTLKEAYEEYLDDMEAAQKVLLAYWAYANDIGHFQYFAPITDIMSVAKGVDRKTSWSSAEKRKFWRLSKRLENTNLTFKCKTGNEWIDAKIPLLNLSITASSSRDQEIRDGYPDKVTPQVLNSALEKTIRNVTEISKGTLLLRPEDTSLAMYPQSRASQRRNDTSTKIDEKYAVELAGLAGTYKSNPRVARKRLKEKLTKMEAAESISKWEETKDGHYILHFRDSRKKVKENTQVDASLT